MSVWKFTGDERDSETNSTRLLRPDAFNRDHTLFRQYSSSLGRWSSPDPLAGDRARPQTWNLYTYGSNNPLRYVDRDGRWSTDTHDLIFSVVLGGLLSGHQLSVVESASAAVDSILNGGQDLANSYQHGMRAPGQDPQQAASQTWNFLNSNLAMAQASYWGSDGSMTDQSLRYFGTASHTVTDLGSPWHTDDNGTPLVWNGLGSGQSWWGHIIPESQLSPMPLYRIAESIYLETWLADQYGDLSSKIGDISKYAADATNRFITIYLFQNGPAAYGSMAAGAGFNGTTFHVSSDGAWGAAWMCAQGNKAACGVF